MNQTITWEMVGNHHFQPFKTGCLGFQAKIWEDMTGRCTFRMMCWVSSSVDSNSFQKWNVVTLGALGCNKNHGNLSPQVLRWISSSGARIWALVKWVWWRGCTPGEAQAVLHPTRCPTRISKDDIRENFWTFERESKKDDHRSYSG